jgi:hypothetical protein
VQVLSVGKPVGQMVTTEGVTLPGEVPNASVFDAAADPSPSRLHDVVGVTDVARVVREGHIVMIDGERGPGTEFGLIVTTIGVAKGSWDP